MSPQPPPKKKVSFMIPADRLEPMRALARAHRRSLGRSLGRLLGGETVWARGQHVAEPRADRGTDATR